MFTALFRRSFSAVASRVVPLALAAALAASQPVFAEQPILVGSVRSANNAPWGKLEFFKGGSKLGFWMRITYSGSAACMTVIPDVVLPDERIRCKFINYDVQGAKNGDVSTSTNWVENGGGELILDKLTFDGSDVAGSMAYTYAGSQNTRRRNIDAPEWVGIRLTTP